VQISRTWVKAGKVTIGPGDSLPVERECIGTFAKLLRTDCRVPARANAEVNSERYLVDPVGVRIGRKEDAWNRQSDLAIVRRESGELRSTTFTLMTLSGSLSC
jgi:hypothetical protein